MGKAWISNLVPDRQQGTAQGLYQGATGSAILLAGAWAGLAWRSGGQVPPLISGSTAPAVAALSLRTFR
ncbi:hypothetical protein AB0D38_04100 [Streptomyces sp. NPDC048279]|uniref:hypothetical protein n=1 Tax=Streptomyces sp. NPDC048279 TaxID=3154714 RepID=UPI00342B9935